MQRREVSQEPPLLYDLTALQKEANGRYGFSADKTLSVAQSLYEKKVLSYPRTGSRYLSDDVFDEIPDRIALLERVPGFRRPCRRPERGFAQPPGRRRGESYRPPCAHHHRVSARRAVRRRRTVYDMVAARLLEAFSARCSRTLPPSPSRRGTACSPPRERSSGLPDGVPCVARVRGRRGDSRFAALAARRVLPLQSADAWRNKHQAPSPAHREQPASAMEHCGRELQDDELRDSLKGNGIGTPATRASIIETLFARDYVRREKKSRADRQGACRIR